MAKISICIPYHDTPRTAFFLSRLLASVDAQTYKDYEVVLTKEGQFARNHNAAITKAKGEYIQMLQMDDYFAHGMALENIVKGIENSDWQITACVHDIENKICNPHQPKWTDDIYIGNNRLGSVSTLSMRKDKALLFEEPLQWLVDCDLYYRLFLKYDYPHINEDFGLVITERTDRLTHTISSIDKQNETTYLLKKYGK